MLRLSEQWPGLPEILQAEDIARFLKFSLLFVLALNVSGLAGALFLQEPGWETVFGNSLVLTLVSGTAIWFLQRKKILPAVYLAVVGNGLWLALAAWMGAGVKGITYAALIMSVLTAALFLGQQAGYLAATASSLYGLFLLLASRMGWLTNLGRPTSELFSWIANTALFFIAAQLIGIALWQVERALKKMRAEIEERSHTEAEIRRLNADLEKRIAERTAQLTASEERYRLISTVIADYVFFSRVNPDGSIVLEDIAGAFEKMTGYTMKEYVARGGWRACLHPDDLAQDDQDLALLHQDQPITSEIRFLSKHAGVRWVQVYAYPRWDARENRLAGIYGAVQDITERKQAEEALRASEKRFRMLVEQLPLVTYLDEVKEYGKTVYLSPQFESMTGYSLAEGVNSEIDFWVERIHPEDRARAQEAYKRCFYAGEALNREYRFLTKDGRYLWVQDRAVRVNDEQGHAEYILGVFQDVTERKLAEERLRAQTVRLSILYELGQRISIARNLEEIYHAAHQAASQLFPAEAFFIALTDERQQQVDYVYLFDKGRRYPNDRVPFNEQSLTTYVIQTGEMLLASTPQDWEILDAGSGFYGTGEDTLSLMIAPLKPAGKVIGAISVQHYQFGMYTEEHRQIFLTLANQVGAAIENSRLVQSLRLQSAALNAAANAIVITDENSIIQWINPAFTAMTGYPAEEAVGQKISILRSGFQEPAFYENLWNTLAAGRVWQGELVNRRKDGSLYFEEQVITPVRDEHGRIFRYVSIKQDITPRKQIEEREKRRREMMEKVIELGKTVTKITDLNHCLREIHQSVQKGLGFDRAWLFLYDATTGQIQGACGTNRAGDIEDTSWFLQSVEEYPFWQNVIASAQVAVNLEEIDTGTTPLIGEIGAARNHVMLAAWAGEKPVAVIAVDNFITGKAIHAEQLEALQLFAGYAGLAIENAQWNAQLERRVAERTAQLEAANREMEGLAYTIAHDLRIPARAMHGFASIIKETEAERLSQDSLHRLERIRESASLMGRQVDDLLEYMRLGRMPLHIQTVNMTNLAKAVAAELLQEKSAFSIHLNITELPDCQGDALLLHRVWKNLLENAIKFTASRPQAEIEIGAQQPQGKTEYFIRDNGVGFDMKFSSNLFGIFQRLHHPEEYEGTGMGLAIVQRILQRHGGRVWAESREGEGATFYFTVG